MIEIGEYIRTIDGYIRKIDNINTEKRKITYYGKYILDIPYKNSQAVAEKKIKAHSKNIIDLIEVGDIVKIKNLTSDFIVSTCYYVFDITLKNILIEDINNKEIELISILTHEQYEQNSYKVVE